MALYFFRKKMYWPIHNLWIFWYFGEKKIWFSARERYFSLLPYVQTGSGSHLTSCSMGNQGFLTWGVKQQVHQVDYSPTSRAAVKNDRNCTSTPPLWLHGITGIPSSLLSTKTVMEPRWNYFFFILAEFGFLGETGTASRSASSGLGKNNVTVSMAGNPAGENLPPFILFKDRNWWGDWNGWLQGTTIQETLQETLALKGKQC